MRKIATPLVVLGLIACFAIPAMAGSLLTEPFTYPDGNLSGNGGWTVYSGGPPPTDVLVASGRATGNCANFPDDHILFTAQPTDVRTYACFNVKITDPGGAPKAVYFAELKDAGSSNLVSRVYVLPLTAGGWTFGISHSSTNTTTASITPWGTALNYDQQYLVAINYDPVNHSSALWVNPVNELSTRVTDVNTSIPALAVSGFGLRQSNSASAFIANPTFGSGSVNWIYSVDDLGVGQTMEDACGGVVPVDRSTWGTLKQIYRK